MVHRWSRTIAEVDLTAIGRNIGVVRQRVGQKKILAVVKANAYGHGMVEITRFLSDQGIGFFAVAHLEEGITLREAGIQTPVLLLAGITSDAIPEMVARRLTPVVFNMETLSEITRHAQQTDQEIGIQIKIDTGMGRLGISMAEAISFIQKAIGQRGVRVEGIMSHFAEADLHDLSYATEQLNLFTQLRLTLEEKGLKICDWHIANSAAILRMDVAHLNCVRPGLMLYGYSPLSDETPLSLFPVMQVKTQILSIKKVPSGTSLGYGRTYRTKRESLIATLAIGYADGYSRSLSNKGIMVAGGVRVTVLGRISMDMTLIDVTKVPGLRSGDWVTVMGAEKGAAIWADEIARQLGTIPYEILCGLHPRIQRVYHS